MQTSRESLASGASGTWLEWKCINRLRTKMSRSKHNMKNWKYIEDDDTTCECKKIRSSSSCCNTSDKLSEWSYNIQLCSEGPRQTMDRIDVVTGLEAASIVLYTGAHNMTRSLTNLKKIKCIEHHSATNSTIQYTIITRRYHDSLCHSYMKRQNDSEFDQYTRVRKRL